METINLTKSARPIQDDDVLSYIQGLDLNKLLINGTPKIGGTHTQDYLNNFHLWLKKYEHFIIDGLEDFTGYITDGITGAFPNFLYFQPTLRPVVLKGEYPIHRLSGIKVLDSILDIKPGDKLYLSHPFSANGSCHPEFDQILKHSKELNIPIFLDCAYFATAKLPNLDLNENRHIKFVAFSLSKVFSTGRMRSGVCYTKESNLPMCINTEWNYVNQASLALHNKLFDQFPANYFYEKYKEKQLSLCKQLNLSPSASYLFGLSISEDYQFFSREKVINRICLSNAIENYSEKPMTFSFSEK